MTEGLAFALVRRYGAMEDRKAMYSGCGAQMQALPSRAR